MAGARGSPGPPQPFRVEEVVGGILFLIETTESRIPLLGGDTRLDELAFIRREVRERILDQRTSFVGGELFQGRGDVEGVDLAREHRSTSNVHTGRIDQKKNAAIFFIQKNLR